MEPGKIKREYDKVLEQLSDPELLSDWQRFEELTKKKNELEKMIEKEKELEELKNKIEENKAILAAKEDSELVALAEAETSQLQEKERLLQEELESIIEKREKNSDEEVIQEKKPASAIIVEIRAGTGGEEAALFAADLFKMYTKYAQNQNWQQKVLDSRQTTLNGFKEVIFEIKNGDVFSKMMYEGGVHRIQRIPQTEKSGRIHTSTATVAILPKPKKAEIKISPQDLKIDHYRASGPGGQYVNKRETAVRITHLPTGLMVASQTERSQLQNKENAMAILEARLLEKKQREEMEKFGSDRKTQIGWAKRSEKIRTYNFPQDRVTDHRIKKSFHNLSEVMEGKLDKIVSALEKSEND